MTTNGPETPDPAESLAGAARDDDWPSLTSVRVGLMIQHMYGGPDGQCGECMAREGAKEHCERCGGTGRHTEAQP